MPTSSFAPYFTFSRDRLAALITAPQLFAELQRLLGGLQDCSVHPLRAKAVEETLALDHDARRNSCPRSSSRPAEPRWSGRQALRELAKQRADIATAMFAMLDKLAISKATGNFALDLGTDFRQDPRTRPVLEKWAAKGSADVKRQANRGLQKL